MNEPDPLPSDKSDDLPKPRFPVRWIGSLVGTLLLVLLCGFQMGRTLLFGWIGFARRVLPAMEVNWPLILIGSGSLVGIILLVHHLGTWFCRERSQTASQNVWRLRASISLSLLIAVMFCAGLSAVGITHQVAWLIRSPNDWMVQRIVRWSSLVDDFGLQNQLRKLDLGILNYATRREQLPFASEGEEEVPRSWPSRIVGTMYSNRKVYQVTSLPWDDEQNRDYFSRVFPDLLNPTLENAPQRDDAGYALSHFEANENMRAFSYQEYESNTSNIIMIGEVRSQFQPWGKPGTYRSLELGLNRHPNGFGGPPSRDSVMFLMMDGSVRTISDTVDPEVLRSLSGAKR
ncbi:DUF1559 domain-containing protein [Stieleria sp. ICT_E10.1]|uniref:DUF1559 domain-containing protein n=1 Tax=Stieleria sedimenti TaxID=2976331 RepID=UPI00217F5471|nr:DUF1559 domain-containing protein [Stieleria sedimenti]MCS7470156.1 DUF1559 domain-containing protein [Stieleria sedimenti]